MNQYIVLSLLAKTLTWTQSTAFSGMPQPQFSLPQQQINELGTVLGQHTDTTASDLASPPSVLLAEISTSTEVFERLTEKVLAPSVDLSPYLEAEVLQGMAHVALDFTSMFSPSRSSIRLATIVGRVFALSADYLPDHLIHPEELMIQLFLMGVAMRELIQDAIKRMTEA